MKKLIVLVLAVACGDAKRETPAPGSASAAVVSPTAAPLPGKAPGDPSCPATGLWARCSVLYRLGRSGIAPKLDSAATVEEKTLHAAESFVIMFPSGSRLEIFLYRDSLARGTDEARLDMKNFKRYPAEPGIARERTLVENGNLIALLTSINDRLRERVDDALRAGAPQPPQPVTIKP